MWEHEHKYVGRCGFVGDMCAKAFFCFYQIFVLGQHSNALFHFRFSRRLDYYSGNARMGARPERQNESTDKDRAYELGHGHHYHPVLRNKHTIAPYRHCSGINQTTVRRIIYIKNRHRGPNILFSLPTHYPNRRKART